MNKAAFMRIMTTGTFNAASNLDGSSYYCEVTNLLGTKYSNTCQAGVITVVIRPPIFRELK